jgi:glycosyltransferase involved in cell wall biosynthesis
LELREVEVSINISVIIPVYNVEKYLRECLDSIVNQSLKNIEIICVNDGSTDNSLEILNEYAQKDDRFVILSQANQGQGVARNKGIDVAQGEYIMFVDPDDWIATGMLELIYNEFKRSNVDVIQFDYTTISETTGKGKISNFEHIANKYFGLKVKDGTIFNIHDFKKVFFAKLPMIIWNKAYSKDFITKNNIKFPPNKHAEDHLFSIKTYFLAKSVLYIKSNLYFYRDRLGSSVNILSDTNFCIFDNLDLTKQFLVEFDFYPSFEKEFNEYNIYLMGTHFNSIKEESREKYKDIVRQKLTKSEYKKFLKNIKNNRSFIENILSFKNKKVEGIKYKVVTILGVELTFKAKRER